MTHKEKMALHQLKGILKAQVTINRITVEVASDTKADPPSEYMEGKADGQIMVASKAIEQGLIVLAELNKILKGDYDG